MMIEGMVGFFGGAVSVGLAWALWEVRRHWNKPPKHVIYRKGQQPQIVMR